MIDVPVAFQNTYSDLLRRTLDASVDAVAQEPGTFVAKTVKGRRYWYHQGPRTADRATRKQTYIGPETPELVERITRSNEQAGAEALRADRRAALVRALVAGGSYPTPPPVIGRTLATLSAAGVFRLRGVLVGTVAFQTYTGLLGVTPRLDTLATEDIDVAQFRSISVAVEEMLPPMLETLRTLDPKFDPLARPLHDRAQAVSYVSSRDVRVEFLTPMRGPVEDAPVPVPALGTGAQPLRFLDYLIYQEQPAAVLYGSGVLVNVPDPTRYAWHKLIVSQRRIANREKARKDVRQAEALFEVLAVDRPEDVRRLWHELAGEGRRRWQDIAAAGLEQVAAPVRASIGRIIAS